MNIVTTMVGMSLMAGASPMLMTMAISPAEASKRAQNFGVAETAAVVFAATYDCLLYTSPSPRDRQKSRMPSSA